MQKFPGSDDKNHHLSLREIFEWIGLELKLNRL